VVTLTAYATFEELDKRLDYTLSEEEKTAATAALEDASNLARYYGIDWPVAAVPPLVKTIVLNAVVRYMRLIEGVVQSRAGDETLTWTDLREKTGTVFLDDDQQRMLASLAGTKKGFWAVPIAAYGGSLRDRTGTGYVKTTGTEEPFAFYANGDV
jgi:hypothetical protein